MVINDFFNLLCYAARQNAINWNEWNYFFTFTLLIESRCVYLCMSVFWKIRLEILKIEIECYSTKNECRTWDIGKCDDLHKIIYSIDLNPIVNWINYF